MTASVLLACLTSLFSLSLSNRSQSSMAFLSIVCWRHRIDSRSLSRAICCDSSIETATNTFLIMLNDIVRIGLGASFRGRESLWSEFAQLAKLKTAVCTDCRPTVGLVYFVLRNILQNLTKVTFKKCYIVDLLTATVAKLICTVCLLVHHCETYDAFSHFAATARKEKLTPHDWLKWRHYCR